MALATGQRGNPRKLGVAGEELEQVYHTLYSPRKYHEENVTFVGMWFLGPALGGAPFDSDLGTTGTLAGGLAELLGVAGLIAKGVKGDRWSWLECHLLVHRLRRLRHGVSDGYPVLLEERQGLAAGGDEWIEPSSPPTARYPLATLNDGLGEVPVDALAIKKSDQDDHAVFEQEA